MFITCTRLGTGYRSSPRTVGARARKCFGGPRNNKTVSTRVYNRRAYCQGGRRRRGGICHCRHCTGDRNWDNTVQYIL